MIDFDDFDDLLGPLRTPATPAELAAESDVVDLMAAAHHSSKGNTMFTSRRARVATLIAAGIIGFGGVAAAGPKVLDLTSDESPSIQEAEQEKVDEEFEDEEFEDEKVDEEFEDEKVEDDVDEEKFDEEKLVEEEAKVEEVKLPEEPADDVVLVDDLDTDFDETYCIPDGNHGKTVSAVARGEDLENEDGLISEGDDDYPSVPDAAHSSCGKTVAAETEDGDDADEVEKQEADHDADEDDDKDHDDEDDDREKSDSDASPKKNGRPDKPGKPEHSNSRGKSDK